MKKIITKERTDNIIQDVLENLLHNVFFLRGLEDKMPENRTKKKRSSESTYFSKYLNFC